MKTCIKILILLSVFSSLQVFAETKPFNRHLQKGDKGEDVRLLQWVLNSEDDTKVSSSGAGSSGNENTTFGEKTKQAVIKYQKKNNLGTQYGLFTIFSGAVDQKTQDALNKDATATSTASSTIDCKTDTSIGGQSKLSIFNAIFNPTTPFSLFASLEKRTTQMGAVLKPDSGASVQDRWAALNGMYKEGVPASSKEPYIKMITISTGSEVLGVPTPVVTDKAKMTIFGCNFATSTKKNTIHLVYNDQKATSTKNGTVIELTLESTLQSLFNGQITKILQDVKDPVTKELEKQIRNNVLTKMKDSLKFSLPFSNSSSSTTSSTTNNSSEQELPGTPLYVTVETENGISNAYQLFLQLQ